MRYKSLILVTIFAAAIFLPIAEAAGPRGNINVQFTTYDAQGNALAFDTMQLFSNSGSLLSTCTASGSAGASSCTFNNLVHSTTYRIDWYIDNMLVGSRSYTAPSSGSTDSTYDFADETLKSLTLRGYHSDGSTRLDSGNFRFYSWDGTNSQWDLEYASTMNSNGEYSLSIWPTASSGEKYMITVYNPGSWSSVAAQDSNYRQTSSSYTRSFTTTYDEPDLAIYSGSNSFPTGTSPGASESVNFRVTNYGSGDSTGTFAYKVYLSSNSQITTGDTEVCSNSGSSISDGSYRQVYCTAQIPSSASGTYYWGAIVDPSNNIDEIDETNNARAFTQVTISGINLDPSTASTSFPSSGYTSDTVSVTSNIANQGSSSSGTFTYKVYLSTDSTITTSDTVFCTDSMSSISSGSSRTDTCSGTLPSSSGTYHWGVIADPGDLIQETDEFDNDQYIKSISVSVQQTINIDPTSSGTTFPSSGSTGESISVTSVFDNEGNSASGTLAYEVYLSTDSTITTFDTLFCIDSTSSISGGSSRSDSCSGTLPSSSGTYYWGVIADPDDYISETDENDNIQYIRSISISDSPTIDLDPTSVGGGFPSSGYTGDSTSVTVNIENHGNSASGTVSYRVYLSTDSQISTSDTLFCSDTMSSIAGGSSQTDTCSANLPNTARTYYWGVIVDPYDSIDEIDETNNDQYIKSISVSDSATIDLEPTSSGSSFPSSGSPGDTVSVTVNIDNNGNSNSGTVAYEVYLSTDTQITSGDTLFCSDSVPSIYSSSSRTDSCTGSLPSISRTYYWGVIVDPNDSISESSENNNDLFGQSISVSDSPTIDVVPTSTGSSFPSSGSPGDTVSVTVNIDNNGNSASGTVSYRVYLSTDSQITSGDSLFCSDSMSSIYSSSSRTDSCTGTLPSSSGTYYWGVIVDPNDSIDESSENNNDLYIQSISVSDSATIDLEPTSSGSSFPSSGSPGDTVSVTVNIDNNGNSASGTVSYRVYLSTDSQITSGDSLFCSNSMFSIYSSSSRTDSCTGTLPSSSGTYYWGVIVDPNDSIDESSENNNDRYFQPISISDSLTIDLRPISCDSCINDGTSNVALRVPFGVSNSGSDIATNVQIKIKFSDTLDLTPTYDDMVYKSTFCTFTFQSIDAFEADSCSAKLSTGNYYFYMIVDPDYQIDETNENNNVAYLDSVKVVNSGSSGYDDEAEFATEGGTSDSFNVLVTLLIIASIFVVIGFIVRNRRGKEPAAPYMIVSDAPTYNAEFNTNPLEQPFSGHINSVATPPSGFESAPLYPQPVVTSTFNDHAISHALDVMIDTEDATPNPPSSTEERIKDLKILKDAEMIDDETYQMKLNQIINDI